MTAFDPTQRYRWRRGEGWSNDLAAYHFELDGLAAALGFAIAELGPVLDQRLPLLHRAAALAHAPRLLIASGFHGEESAGPWGVLPGSKA
jgi:hypothetical protein